MGIPSANIYNNVTKRSSGVIEENIFINNTAAHPITTVDFFYTKIRNVLLCVI